ncbi:MAG: SCO family protein [Myxococcales bacterium]|nr:SCO family protein [Myxococcales bacterium]MBL0197078.1 SCO family protein [Myxococcales bacterium]HQY63400.1 SCO family protein [Polyangiaceae bacterium]
MKTSLLLAFVAVLLLVLRARAGATEPASQRAAAVATQGTPAQGGGASLIPFYSTADFTAEWLAPVDPRYARIHRVGPFSLRDQQGELVSNASLRGKLYVASFFFTQCTSLCPKMLVNLRRVQRAFQDEPRVILVSHSVMPSVDSEAVLRRYARENGVDGQKWKLVSGDKETVYALARRSYFAEKRAGLRKSDRELLHTENMLIVDGEGRLRGVFNATLPVEADRAIDELRQLLRELP